jgi:5-deoxy-glucuronate isomerase
MTAIPRTPRGKLLRRARPGATDEPFVGTTPADAGWTYLSVAVHRVMPGASISRPADDQEVVVIALEGDVAVDVGDRSFAGVGGRDSVFDPRPAGLVLAEPRLPILVHARTEALVVVASAPGKEARSTRAIGRDEILVEERGTGNARRRVHHLLPPSAVAGRLIAFEVVTPGGNWSSFPPHKHDTEEPPREAYLEEVYLYRFARPGAFAFQRVYTGDRTLDETMTVGDGDLALVPRGYHVVAAAPGYDCYYLNVMAGHDRNWRFTVDPDHEWLMDWTPPGAGTGVTPDGDS